MDSQSPSAAELNPGVWLENLPIRSYDVDFHKRATAEALCRSFLEAAWNHAEQLGFGYLALAGQNKLWVLSRLLVQIDLYPHWGDNLQLRTWPRGTSGVFALRDFEICSTAGQRMAVGSSSWLVLDATTHRPQRIDKLFLPAATPETRSGLGRDPKKLPDSVMTEAAFTAAVQYTDIDVNRHVNSARYVGWLLNAYPAEFLENHELRTLEINYVGEARWTDILSVQSRQRSELEFVHCITKGDQLEVCRAEFLWAPEAG
jgi:medium-chain acyl-[acyl-carrier-protein] hydrolase